MSTASLSMQLDLDSDSDSEFRNVVLLYSAQKNTERSLWTSKYMQKRKTHGEYVLSTEVSDQVFKESFRLNRRQFEEVHTLIEEDIRGKASYMREPIPTKEKFAVCLRYLTTGDMFKTIALSYRMGQRTVSKIVYDVCGAIWKHLQPIYLPEPTTVMWENIASDFERKWQFYNCIGAIDDKHVTVRKPCLSGSSFFNYKMHCSVVLLATVNAHYRFTSIDTGSMGRFSDANIFSNSVLGRKLTDGALNIHADKSFPGQQNSVPYVFVGDEAFPLLKHLMRPYPKCRVAGNDKNKVFNYRLSRARQTVECAFGILSSRFRVFKRPFECKLKTVDRIVSATCILHNYLRTENIMASDLGREEEDIEPLSINQLLSPAPIRCRSTNEAFLTREKFNQYFNSPEGSVQWQYAAIRRGQY